MLTIVMCLCLSLSLYSHVCCRSPLFSALLLSLYYPFSFSSLLPCILVSEQLLDLYKLPPSLRLLSTVSLFGVLSICVLGFECTHTTRVYHFSLSVLHSFLLWVHE